MTARPKLVNATRRQFRAPRAQAALSLHSALFRRRMRSEYPHLELTVAQRNAFRLLAWPAPCARDPGALTSAAVLLRVIKVKMRRNKCSACVRLWRRADTFAFLRRALLRD